MTQANIAVQPEIAGLGSAQHTQKNPFPEPGAVVRASSMGTGHQSQLHTDCDNRDSIRLPHSNPLLSVSENRQSSSHPAASLQSPVRGSAGFGVSFVGVDAADKTLSCSSGQSTPWFTFHAPARTAALPSHAVPATQCVNPELPPCPRQPSTAVVGCDTEPPHATEKDTAPAATLLPACPFVASSHTSVPAAVGSHSRAVLDNSSRLMSAVGASAAPSTAAHPPNQLAHSPHNPASTQLLTLQHRESTISQGTTKSESSTISTFYANSHCQRLW